MNELSPPPKLPVSWEASHAPLHMTADEFLAWEGDGSGRKLILVDGEVWAMSPASALHGTIQSNLSFLMLTAIEASSLPLRVVSEGAIVPALHAKDNVRVPDLVVAPEGGVADEVVVNEPVALLEILSPGNKSLTRNNVRAYATLPGVLEIVVIHTSRVEVEVLRRDGAGAWPPDPEHVRPGGRLRLHTAGLDCAVERVYARTKLAGRGSAR